MNFIVWVNNGNKKRQYCVRKWGSYGSNTGRLWNIKNYDWCIDDYLEKLKDLWGCGDCEFTLVVFGVSGEEQREQCCVNLSVLCFNNHFGWGEETGEDVVVSYQR